MAQIENIECWRYVGEHDLARKIGLLLRLCLSKVSKTAQRSSQQLRNSSAELDCLRKSARPSELRSNSSAQTLEHASNFQGSSSRSGSLLHTVEPRLREQLKIRLRAKPPEDQNHYCCPSSRIPESAGTVSIASQNYPRPRPRSASMHTTV